MQTIKFQVLNKWQINELPKPDGLGFFLRPTEAYFYFAQMHKSYVHELEILKYLYNFNTDQINQDFLKLIFPSSSPRPKKIHKITN